MTGPVERAVRAHISDGQRLRTAAQGAAPFTFERLTPDALVLLLGAGEHRTPIPWQCLEGVPAFLRGRDWVTIGTVFSPEADGDTLDGYLKQSVNRAHPELGGQRPGARGRGRSRPRPASACSA